MIRKKTPLILAAAFLLNLSLTSAAFAVENIEHSAKPFFTRKFEIGSAKSLYKQHKQKPLESQKTDSPSTMATSPQANYKYPDYGYEFTGKDSCENFNRKLFIFNLKLNKYLLRPVNTVWASVMPQYGMDRVKCAYNNVNFPVRVVSSLIQKDYKTSKQEMKRFFINTTIGIGGLYDTALTKFNIEPRSEDMAQALAYRHCKRGSYLVLPVVHGNIRDLVGQLLDVPLKPTSYIPYATTGFFINNTAYTQPMIKRIETTYADPYELVRQADGVENYIKNVNLDRKEVYAEKLATQNIVKISNLAIPVVKSELKSADLKADIELTNYKPQSPLVDALRTALFEGQNPNKSIWSDISIWNRNFEKKIKNSYVSIDSTRAKYKYRYILQKNKMAPLAIIYPSIGEGITSDHSTTMARILYKEGYSVVIQGSSCQWEFVKSMPVSFKPGLPAQDARYLRLVSAKILDSLLKKHVCIPDRKIIVGSSFGAITALFTAAQEDKENTLGISHYIAINPPIETLYALKQVDKYSQAWKDDTSDIKVRAALTAEKVIRTYQNISNTSAKEKPEFFPFTDDEAKLITGFVMKQKLSDLVFTIENGSRSKKSDIYEKINNMSFFDYAQKYLFVNQNKPIEQIDYESSLYSLADFLQKSDKYKIYHTLDDYFVNPEQLAWLKNQTQNKSVFFNNGSHLGFLYRKEFLDDFKKETAIKNAVVSGGV